jgi:hypothetical protein
MNTIRDNSIGPTKRGAVLTLEVPTNPLVTNLLYHYLKRKEQEKKGKEHGKKE